MFTDILYIWSDSQALSVAIWLVISITVLYFGRPHAHQLFRSTGRAIAGSLRLAAGSIRQLEERVAERNRDVLLAQGREESEKTIEREFARVHAIVERDLSQYPSLHKKLAAVLQKVEADYRESTQDAPLPPAWSEVVSTISNLPSTGDPTVVRILDNIKAAVEKSHRETLKAHQKNVAERHRHLPALIGLDPELLSDDSLSAAVLILGRLRRALRAERRRAGSGHWTYDLNRHIALRQAYAAERRRWAELKKGAPARSRRPSS
jgi:hypothetical protein